MKTFNLGEMFIPTKLANTDYETGRMNNPAFSTCDRVFLDVAQPENEIGHCTDYAVMCGAYNRGQRAAYWYRAGCRVYLPNFIFCNDPSGKDCDITDRFAEYPVIRPVMHIDVDAFLKFRNHPETKESDTKIHQNGNLHQVTFGLEFPSEHVNNRTGLILNSLRTLGKLEATGATYFSYYQGMYGGKVRSTEYKYSGQKYVDVTVRRFDDKKDPFYFENILFHQASIYNDGTKCPATGRHTWAKVQPIYFTIRNWDDLPHSINPHGTSKANYMDVIADRGILATPLAIRFREESLWQNCVPRAYLNDYNIYQELDRGNGNCKYKADVNHDYSGNGFLFEASQSLRERCPNIFLDLRAGKLKHLKQINPNHLALRQEGDAAKCSMDQKQQDCDMER